MNLLQSSLIKISDISFNTGQIPDVPKNPRFIKNERYEKLKKSLQDNPEMLPARELLVYNYDGELIVIGGNMRLRAAKELGYKEIPCKILEDLTAEQIRAIVIKDNVSFGSDDFEQLANEWDSIELEEWGLEVPTFDEIINGDNNDKDLFSDNGIEAKNQYGVIVICENAGTQESVFNDLTNMGFNCKIVVT